RYINRAAAAQAARPPKPRRLTLAPSLVAGSGPTRRNVTMRATRYIGARRGTRTPAGAGRRGGSARPRSLKPCENETANERGHRGGGALGQLVQVDQRPRVRDGLRLRTGSGHGQPPPYKWTCKSGGVCSQCASDADCAAVDVHAPKCVVD